VQSIIGCPAFGGVNPSAGSPSKDFTSLALGSAFGGALGVTGGYLLGKEGRGRASSTSPRTNTSRTLFVSSPRASVTETSKIGKIRADKRKLEKLFGAPQAGDGEDTHYEWVLTHTPTRSVVTLYDWHRRPGEEKIWHVGGLPRHKEEILRDLRKALR
jgi:hypothetical protein